MADPDLTKPFPIRRQLLWYGPPAAGLASLFGCALAFAAGSPVPGVLLVLLVWPMLIHYYRRHVWRLDARGVTLLTGRRFGWDRCSQVVVQQIHHKRNGVTRRIEKVLLLRFEGGEARLPQDSIGDIERMQDWIAAARAAGGGYDAAGEALRTLRIRGRIAAVVAGLLALGLWSGASDVSRNARRWDRELRQMEELIASRGGDVIPSTRANLEQLRGYRAADRRQAFAFRGGALLCFAFAGAAVAVPQLRRSR